MVAAREARNALRRRRPARLRARRTARSTRRASSGGDRRRGASRPRPARGARRRRRPLHRRLDEHGPGGGARAAAARPRGLRHRRRAPRARATTTRSSSTACRRTTARRSPRRSLYGPQSAVWDEAENRLHAQKALLALDRPLVLPLKDNVPTRSFPIVTVGADRDRTSLVCFLYQLPDLDRLGRTSSPTSRARSNDSCRGRRRGLADHRRSPRCSCTASWLHLAGNMLFLWIFGNNVEDALGPRALPRLLSPRRARRDGAPDGGHAPDSAPRVDASVPNLGASGAISGVLGAYLVLLPRAKVLTLIFLVFFFLREIPAVLFLGIWFALPALGGRVLARPPARRAAASRSSRTSAASSSACSTVCLFRKRAPAATGILMVTLRGARPRGARLAARRHRAAARERRGRGRGRAPGGARPPRPLRGRRARTCRPRSTIYRLPLEADFPDPAELEREIRITVLHELAHYFGIDEDRLEELGYE